ncbi:SdiA-regulated domain-containing protein [Flavihumibacter rivuli]|uniref:SdiA-regulated domain-containing protein n=1 Tax=Flavihumibacter rivuli TaxID=2838156 RepID=UPI001BDF13BE|nr:SdiA-regulated domain-containing protein [Flavihumibacter rivuli]ULQ56150.1 SdiA-regulated domain-containing protein [Flavihumibacter rivuli]
MLFFHLLGILGLSFTSCNRLDSLAFVPAIPGYGEKPLRTVLLKKPLREISGITYASPGKLVGINDEDGVLFTIDANTGQFTEQEFGKEGDYEDIVAVGEHYYVLKSNGNIHKIDSRSGKEVKVIKGDFDKFTEFESLCYDSRSRQLLMICKTCGANAPYVNIWRVDLTADAIISQPIATIAWKEIRRIAKNDALECQPSAAAFHPVTNELYIIASIGKVLLRCNAAGEPLAVYGINPDIFPQPEGIAFGPDGEMYITNEGRQSKASLLVFPYRK